MYGAPPDQDLVVHHDEWWRESQIQERLYSNKEWVCILMGQSALIEVLPLLRPYKGFEAV